MISDSHPIFEKAADADLICASDAPSSSSSLKAGMTMEIFTGGSLLHLLLHFNARNFGSKSRCIFLRMIFTVGMTIWVLALVLLASLAGLGYRQGVIRVAFSLIGIFISALLAGPLSGLFKPLLPHLGIHNPVAVWLLAPLVVFVILLSLFKSAGFFVNRKVDVYYKYKTDELQQMLWSRLNHRLGMCLGLVNGLVYLVLISFVIYDFSYWTAQWTVNGASPDGESRSVRMLNQMGHDLESTGLAKVARAVDPLPEIYFKAADLAGLLYQNPQLSDRLADYPPFISLDERDDFKQLAQDNDFQDAWKNHAPAGQLLNYASAVRALWTEAYAQTVFETGSDGQAFLKNLPDFKTHPPTPETWTGTWTADDTNYDLTLSSNGENRSMTAQTDGVRLTIKDDRDTLIFDRND